MYELLFLSTLLVILVLNKKHLPETKYLKYFQFISLFFVKFMMISDAEKNTNEKKYLYTYSPHYLESMKYSIFYLFLIVRYNIDALRARVFFQ